MSAYTEVLFDVMPGTAGDLGIIVLNRASALNSLNQNMIQAMYSQLTAWADDPAIKCVVIRAAPGRAFCAGGDLKLTYERYRDRNQAITEFFREEYQLNCLIFNYPKPYIAFLDGITMGGGVGISIHGSHRIGTDKLLFAMPETGIGFYPDVGGTYFLPRLPGYFGCYLGLTGAHLKSDDCLALGIIQQKVMQDSLTALLEALAAHPFDDDSKAAVTHVIDRFKVPARPSELLAQQDKIDNHFSHESVEKIMQVLESASDSFSSHCYQTLLAKSPTSLKVTLKALQRGQNLDFSACMAQEFVLTQNFLKAHDFMEGIRALIIEKDQAPRWQPTSLADVSISSVDAYFEDSCSPNSLVEFSV